MFGPEDEGGADMGDYIEEEVFGMLCGMLPLSVHVE